MTTFSIKKACKDSWNLLFSKELFQKIAFVFIATAVPVMIVASLMEESLVRALQGSSAVIPILLFVISLGFILYTSVVSIKTSVAVLSVQRFSITKIFKSSLHAKTIARLLALFAFVLLMFALVFFIVGLLGRLIPVTRPILFSLALLGGIFVSIRLFFASYFIVDKKHSFWLAVKSSFKATRKIQLKLIGLLFIVLLIGLLSGLISELSYAISPLIQSIISYVVFTITLSPFISFLLASPYVQTQHSK